MSIHRDPLLILRTSNSLLQSKSCEIAAQGLKLASDDTVRIFGSSSAPTARPLGARWRVYTVLPSMGTQPRYAFASVIFMFSHLMGLGIQCRVFGQFLKS